MIHFLVRFPYMKQIGHVFLYYIISTRTQYTLPTLTDAGISLHRAIYTLCATPYPSVWSKIAVNRSSLSLRTRDVECLNRKLKLDRDKVHGPLQDHFRKKFWLGYFIKYETRKPDQKCPGKQDKKSKRDMKKNFQPIFWSQRFHQVKNWNQKMDWRRDVVRFWTLSAQHHIPLEHPT